MNYNIAQWDKHGKLKIVFFFIVLVFSSKEKSNSQDFYMKINKSVYLYYTKKNIFFSKNTVEQPWQLIMNFNKIPLTMGVK